MRTLEQVEYSAVLEETVVRSGFEFTTFRFAAVGSKHIGNTQNLLEDGNLKPFLEPFLN